ncbi:DUF6493 family protein [Nonomuraea sp. MTCD27]|uniref:DUF7825 domain-containing protein n=1 Tax=Nonomuraea sp. MTCD27 TaxID=1676747 RepID=UPI0035C101DA
MNPWTEVLDRIDAGDDEDLARFLDGLSDLGRQAVARQLPAHLAEELGGGFLARREVEALATGYRLAGAACLPGAAQVAAWLDRRELRRPRDPDADAARIVSVLRRRPEKWRRVLAERLVGRLRIPAERDWRRLWGLPGWDVAAALAIETGLGPPDGDAFVAGWVWALAGRKRRSGGAPVLAADPLLDDLLPHLFHAQGVGRALALDEWWNPGRTIAGELAGLAEAGRVPRQALIDGCAGRFLAGGEAAEITPFVTLWRWLRTTPGEIPVLDFVRLLPSATSPLVRLALDELHRAEAAGALDAELFAEAVGALAFRPEPEFAGAAVKWLADAPPSRSGGAVAALASVFDAGTRALRERAVRLAVKLAPHAGDEGREAIREAATRLPADLRERVAAGYGAVPEPDPEPWPAPVLAPSPPPVLAPPIGTVAELARELTVLSRAAVEPQLLERVLAALVELTHHDRDGVAAALRPWWLEQWHQPFDARFYAHVANGYDRDPRFLLLRCALAVVSPEHGRELSALPAGRSHDHPPIDVLPQRLVRRRLREVVALFERGETIPVLLATPTAATGHVGARTLIERMERLGETEPLEADFQQALLRLPRHVDPALLVRAEKLPSQAGRRLAAWLRDGGLPDPVVDWKLRRVRHDGDHRWVPYEVRPSVVPPEGLPDWLAELCAVERRSGYLAYPRDVVWWPAIMPSHPEVVAAHLLLCLPRFLDGSDARLDAVTALAHADGPVGAATAITIAAALGHRRPAPRATAADALTVLAVRGRLPAAELGRAIAELIRAELVVLGRITPALAELASGGAHAEIWRALAVALPSLLPAPGERPRAGLGELLEVAVQAAALTGVRCEIRGLADLAARKGSSHVLKEARRLHLAIS